MHAAYIERLGPPDVIGYGPLPEPRPGPTDVLVDVAFTTVNPVDTYVRSGAYRTPVEFPFVIGRDLVGTVVEAGGGAPGFHPGDRVWCNSLGHGGRQGAAAERGVVPVGRLYHLPGGVDPRDAVVTLHPAATAFLALFTHGRARPGETAVVIGAGGNVGGTLLVLAAEAGIRTVAVAGARDAEHCRALGAAATVDYRAGDWRRQVGAAAPGGADLYIDTAGSNDVPAAVELLAPRGRIVVLAGLGSRPELPVGPLYLAGGSVAGFTISAATTTELADAAGAVNRLLAAGRLPPRSFEELPLRRAADAHRRLEAGELHGKRVALRVG